MSAYLRRYAEAHGLVPHVRVNTGVDHVGREPGGAWTVRSGTPDRQPTRETYAHVVVASGRYQKPVIPDLPGLATFSGTGSVGHTSA